MAPNPPQIGSNRSFGLVFCGFFALVALVPLLRHHPLRAWALAPSALFLVATLVAPKSLTVPNRIWTRFGHVLNIVLSPIQMGILFFLLVTPFSVLMRFLGKDPLRLKIDRSRASYWITRDPAGPPPETMKFQF